MGTARALRAFIMAGFVASGALVQAAPKSSRDLQRFTFTEYHMGINARIVLYTRSQGQAEAAAEAAFKRIAELEQIMSDYRPTSEIMRLCDRAGSGPVRISPDLFRVLERAQILARQTDGAFDVTVGPLIQLWRTARREAKLPTIDQIEAAKRLVGYRKLQLDPVDRTASLQVKGMRLDLGGIAKGYACDEALKELRKRGVRSALIEMGGDIRLGDAPPGTDGWSIDVPNASEGRPASMRLKNCAISTSGDTEQFVVIDGVRYSHVVDPATGIGLTNRVQASVIAPNAFASDPISTALTVLPAQRRTKFIASQRGVRAYVKTVSPG